MAGGEEAIGLAVHVATHWMKLGLLVTLAVQVASRTVQTWGPVIVQRTIFAARSKVQLIRGRLWRSV